MEKGEPIAVPPPEPREKKEKKKRNISAPIDHSTGQAAALVQAAEEGVPFCEICRLQKKETRDKKRVISNSIKEDSADKSEPSGLTTAPLTNENTDATNKDSLGFIVGVVNSYDASEGIAHRVSVQLSDGVKIITRKITASDAAAGYSPLAECSTGTYRIQVEPFPPPGQSIGPKDISDEFLQEVTVDFSTCQQVQFTITRKQSILHNIPMTFRVADNPKASGGKPLYELACMSQVALHRELIETEADKQGVDLKLVKSIVYMETTHGYYDSFLEPFDKNNSIRPMNVRSGYWKELGFTREQLKHPVYNIRAGILLLERISSRALPRSIEMIASLYQDLGTDKLTDYGMRVAKIYENELWIPEPSMLDKINKEIYQFQQMNPRQQLDALRRIFGDSPNDH